MITKNKNTIYQMNIQIHFPFYSKYFYVIFIACCFIYKSDVTLQKKNNNINSILRRYYNNTKVFILRLSRPKAHVGNCSSCIKEFMKIIRTQVGHSSANESLLFISTGNQKEENDTQGNESKCIILVTVITPFSLEN